MCTGIEIALLGAAALSAAGAVQQGVAAKGAADDKAQILGQQAGDQRQTTVLEARRSRAEASRLAGRRQALIAGSGVQTSTGTPLLIKSQAKADAEFEALLIEAQGERGARRLEQSAEAAKARGRNQLIGSIFQAGGTFIGGLGASKAASSKAAASKAETLG